MNYKQIKLLAVFCMAYDHVNRIFPLKLMLAPLADRLWAAGHPVLADWIYQDLAYILLYVGRLAAPVFLYCAVQGYRHTGSLRRYLRRVLLTAVIAQGPYILFDLAESRLYGIQGGWQDCGLNILFTLALGLAALAAYDRLSRTGTPLGLLAALAAGGLARLLNLEGREGYILLMFVFYLTRDLSRLQRAALYLPAAVLSRWGLVQWLITDPSSGVLRNVALNILGCYLGMLLTLAYREERGSAGKGFQRLMYAFYPAHFLALALIGFLRPPF